MRKKWISGKILGRFFKELVHLLQTTTPVFNFFPFCCPQQYRASCRRKQNDGATFVGIDKERTRNLTQVVV